MHLIVYQAGDEKDVDSAHRMIDDFWGRTGREWGAVPGFVDGLVHRSRLIVYQAR